MNTQEELGGGVIFYCSRCTGAIILRGAPTTKNTSKNDRLVRHSQRNDHFGRRYTGISVECPLFHARNPARANRSVSHSLYSYMYSDACYVVTTPHFSEAPYLGRSLPHPNAGHDENFSKRLPLFYCRYKGNNVKRTWYSNGTVVG